MPAITNMKTVKKWKSFDFGDENQQPKSSSVCSKQSVDFNFFEQLEPKLVSDLAVHTKKIKEVEDWLKFNVISKRVNCKGTAILVIVGPTGCGKTTTLNVLCQSLKIQISEWVNPVDREFDPGRASGQTAQLLEFLSEAKYPSLFSVCGKKITLIEDFPNSVIHNPSEFHSVLRKCYSSGGNPVVFICTESGSGNLNLTQSLFPQEIRDEFNIHQISFNPCPPTLLKNALKRAHDLLQNKVDLLKTPSSDTVNAIISSAAGDLRCAVNQYYFAALKGTQELPTVSTAAQKPGTKRKRLPPKTTTIKTMMRDETLGLFHGLGRVLNPKREQKGDRHVIQCDFNRLIDEFSTQPTTIQNFLFENYVRYFGDAVDATKGAEVLSVGEFLLSRWKEGHEGVAMGLWFVVLGLMVVNEHKVAKWNQLKAPTRVKKTVNNDLQTKCLDKTDLYYYNVITKSNSFHNFV